MSLIFMPFGGGGNASLPREEVGAILLARGEDRFWILFLVRIVGGGKWIQN